jgi:hypothetical protein
MDQRPDRTLLDESLGETVFFQYLGARPPSDEHMADLINDPDQVVYSQPQVLSLFVLLESYDQFGVTVQSLSEDRLRSFVPWGAILYLYRVDDGSEDAS